MAIYTEIRTLPACLQAVFHTLRRVAWGDLHT